MNVVIDKYRRFVHLFVFSFLFFLFMRILLLITVIKFGLVFMNFICLLKSSTEPDKVLITSGKNLITAR